MLSNTLHASSILPTFGIHVINAHKDIRLITTLNDLFINMPALFKDHYTGTSIEDPHESDRVWLHPFLLHLFK
jgi:hypothetical protein